MKMRILPRNHTSALYPLIRAGGQETPSLTYLGSISAVVDRRLETSPQSTLSVASSEKLPDLSSKLPHLTLVDLGLRGVECRGVEVDARVLVKGVDVDGAPGVAQRSAGVLLDDGHGRFGFVLSFNGVARLKVWLW